jgi:hypothetical protein
MKWVKHDSAAIVSDDGRYSVCQIGGKDGFFEAWRTRKHEDGPHLISTNLPDAQAARKACVDDRADDSR